MIACSAKLFDGDDGNSPPLPPAPLEEPAIIDFGSGYTKLYPPSSSPKKSERSSDFNPSMPNRLDQSIHPGARRAQGGGSSASASPRTVQSELSPLSRHQGLGVDLASPTNEVPPAPPPASEKKRVEGKPFPPSTPTERRSLDRRSMDRRSEDNPRRSFQASAIDEVDSSSSLATLRAATDDGHSYGGGR